jgi:hypothetical protein
MTETIITDSVMRARIDYPEARVVGSVAAALYLANGTRVRIAEYAVGTVNDGPCHVARVMIARGDLVEVVG